MPPSLGPTSLDLAGSVLLGLVCALAFAASMTSARRGARPGLVRFWQAAAAILLAATLYRAMGGEHVVTERLRQAATGEGWYGDRRVGQALITSFGVVVAAAALWFGLRFRAPPEVRLAGLALVGYIILSGARVVSLHMIDGLLYRSLGPIHANWLFELVLVGTIAGCAVFTIVRVPPRRPLRERHRR